ncbi:MAG: Gfo/Idh/MocA family oxidoreductase [Planctomycetes bacterium]|nr:Gfo/Idh/MocA family oxidoreductase [Planctomycetota bacterium]
MNRIRIGVVGVGHLGRSHARLLHGMPEAELVGVADIQEAAAQETAALYQCRAFTDHRALAGLVDAVCVVVPTKQHREVAGFFLEHGIDVLVEKPITATVAEARELVQLAARHGRILQVGHVERFNPVLRELQTMAIRPRYVEAQRLAPFSFRSTDIGVVLDLMIHDLDLVQALLGTPVRSVEAFGGAVFTPAEDMASATVQFEGGAVAHLSASRVALRPMRRMRLFAKDGYVSLDFQTATGVLIRKNPGWDFGKLDLSTFDRSQAGDLWKYVFEGLLHVEEFKLDAGNPLADELLAFLHSVRDRSRPMVSGEDGLSAVETAERILESIRQHPW